MRRARRLLFVSTRFLFPIDSGGKVRTTQVLRGLKSFGYEIVLVSPAGPGERISFEEDLGSVCDAFESWPVRDRDMLFKLMRLRHLFNALPIAVRTDWSVAGAETVQRILRDYDPEVVVFDFAHSAVLATGEFHHPSVMFTHNVEAEIFERHAARARNGLLAKVWHNQARKMADFENGVLQLFDVIVGVSDRDAAQFRDRYGLEQCHVIPTGVDLDFFDYSPPERDAHVVFSGSMDWLANQDAIVHFMEDIWPRIRDLEPDAQMTVVGRDPPPLLVKRARERGLNWTFTGFVDDVRPHLRGAAVSVIPLRIGGGTRLKVYEAMALGTPVVSTSIGVEGLPVLPDRHYLNADTGADFADAVVCLLRDRQRRTTLAEQARGIVVERYSHINAANEFANACERAIAAHQVN